MFMVPREVSKKSIMGQKALKLLEKIDFSYGIAEAVIYERRDYICGIAVKVRQTKVRRVEARRLKWKSMKVSKLVFYYF